MVGKYIRKSDRQSWAEEDMRQAIEAVRNNRMGWLRASRVYNVPFSTLRRRAVKNCCSKGYLGGKLPTFNSELEVEILEHVKNLEVRFFGLSTMELRTLAFQVAEARGLRHPFSAEKKAAGWDWLKGFLHRNPSVSLRTPESTSAARARAFNKIQIAKYFKNLERVMSEHSFSPQNIWNMDESGLATVPSKNTKIIATKGRKQVGILTSAERGQHLTVVCCLNALGTYVPPAFIFPRKNMKAELMDRAPTGAIGLAQEKGWMCSDTFVQWLHHFVKHVKPSAENKVLLLLDGHSSHKSLPALDFAKKNGIVMFCFPPHCTHRVQPLDVCFFSPLTTYYNQELTTWLKNHPGRTVSHFQVAELFKEAYNKAATIGNAVKGFSTTGIFPFNSNIFPEDMFAPADVTDVQETADLSKARETNESQEVSAPLTPEKSHIPVRDIFPLPVAPSKSTSNKRRKPSKQGVLNSTPELAIAKAIAAEKEEKARRKSARQVKKKVLQDDSSNDEMPVESNDDDDDDACLYCNELFSLSRSREKWIRCQDCNKWCHSECAGVSNKVKQFICDICKD